MKITEQINPFMNYHMYVKYGKYYRLGLRKLFLEDYRTQGALLGKWLLGNYRGSERMRSLLKKSNFLGTFSASSARYVLNQSGSKVRFVIDADDNHQINNMADADWADVYFKANMWKGVEYPQNVRPIVNCNGRLDFDSLAELKSLRSMDKEVDVCFISRIWGGIEHNIRLFEELAKLECKKDLLAIFPTEESKKRGWDRLESQGVKCSMQNIPLDDLWARMAKSRIIFFRSGVKLCIPWRMIDLLAMGACILFDDAPRPQWPEKLREGVNYVDCNLDARLDSEHEDYLENVDYSKIQRAVHHILENPGEASRISESNANYFDENASPEKVAEYCIGVLRKNTRI